MDKCAAACALENSKLFEGIGEEDIRHMMECSGAKVKNSARGNNLLFRRQRGQGRRDNLRRSGT